MQDPAAVDTVPVFGFLAKIRFLTPRQCPYRRKKIGFPLLLRRPISINPAQISPSESAVSKCSDTVFSHSNPLDLQECPLLLITEAHMEESRVQVNLKRITRSYRVWITMSWLGSIGALFQSCYIDAITSSLRPVLRLRPLKCNYLTNIRHRHAILPLTMPL